MKYYVLTIWGDVEPSLSDPFDSEEERDRYAKTCREEDPEMKKWSLQA